MSFNVLTDPWIPLADAQGRTTFASYRDVMTGTKDAPDLVHARDDVRFFSRMLLSALTQALFGDLALDGKTLLERVREPLPADVVDPRIADVKDDFDLFGDSGFLQGDPRSEAKKGNKASKGDDGESVNSLLYDAAKHRLYRRSVGVETVGKEEAVPLLYAAQAFCRKGGRGYFLGVRGTPPLTTLVRLSTVRQSIWANVLHGQRRTAYPPEKPRPWRQGHENADGPIGLVEGLFWQPLAARLRQANASERCAASGRHLRAEDGVRVQRLGGRMSAGGTFYPHPYSPALGEGGKVSFVHLQSGRPAWTGLANALPGVREEDRRQLARPAPVVEQWAELAPDEDAKLLLIDHVTKDANVRARFVETYSLRESIRDDKLADFTASRIEEADKALKALRERLYPAKKKRDSAFRGRAQGRKNASDVTAMFWQRTEPAFWAWFDARVRGEDRRDEFRETVRKTTLRIYDEVTDVLTHDPAALARVVANKNSLCRDLQKMLFPKPRRGAA